MRIAFLCSGLEPGRDGVGDYTRRLAAACILHGHDCRLIALNDSHLSSGADDGRATQESDGVRLEVLRCAASLPWPERVVRVREMLEAFAPDWVSLQFVPYGFQPKGIPWNFARYFKEMIGARPLQIMFHELWIGFGQAPSLKECLVGGLQRHCIFRMLSQLQPRLVQTSNTTYVGMLQRGGVSATVLPLFGNIPVLELAPDAPLPRELLEAGVTGDRRDWWLALFFGTLHPEWEPEPLFGFLSRAAKQAGKRLCLISAGRIGRAGEAIWERLRRDYSPEFGFVKCGEQSPAQISTLLQVADFGIAASPWNLIGKSGTAAAMLDHGLPIIFTREEESARMESPADPLFHRGDATLETKLVAGLTKRLSGNRLEEISLNFIAALQKMQN